MSKLRCPMCKEELNVHFDAFTCYSACGGPYVRGRISLVCSNDEGNHCNYQHATNFQSSDGKSIHGFETLVSELVRKLPDFGPWEVFKITAGQNKRRRGNKR
jgi:hypothetical protein